MESFTFSLVGCRTLTDPDIEQMAQMYVVAFSGPPWNEIWSMEEAKREIMRCIEVNMDFVISKTGDTIVGFGIAQTLQPNAYTDHDKLAKLGLNPNGYYVRELVTHHLHRKRGICSQILTRFIEHAEESRYPEICLRTRSDNTPLFGVLESCKLRKIAEYEASTGGVISTRFVFHLPIG